MMPTKRRRGITFVLLGYALCLSACGDQALNNPHTDYDDRDNIRFDVFSESPKTLDPARSYSSNEYRFIGQIVEPLLQYDHDKRPYTLVPLTAAQMPTIRYLDANNQPVEQTSPNVDTTVYELELQPGIRYQAHPAFAQSPDGHYLYHELSEADLEDIEQLGDFEQQTSRELTADDYAYQIKRLADPKVQSPIYGLMSDYIVGLKQLNQQLQDDYKQHPKQRQRIDLRDYDLSGVEVLDRYHLRIKIHKQYAQFIYWLAMPFFAPMPWEADWFYQQEVLKDKNITADWYPIGTGAYFLSENNPNSRMVLSRNPYYRLVYLASDTQHLHPLPFIDKHVFSLEKESIPQWTKFLQGYYDMSGISADSFDQAIQIGPDGQPSLSDELAKRGIRLYTTIEPTIYYMGFNMLDEVVGGNSERARKLRQAINQAIDYDEYISIFLNGRGIIANGPIPPGIFGYDENDNHMSKPAKLAKAKQLLTEAGYANGVDPNTQQPLIVNYDVPASAGPEEQARLNWMRKQFAKIGIQLHVRATQYNRFQQKMRTGNAQIFSWGWSADYPDPENFLFLFYSPNAKVKYGGENASNYVNNQFDRYFETMRDLPNGEQRLQLINQMTALLKHDSPWVWGFHPKTFQLTQSWVMPFKPNAFSHNQLQYLQIDPIARQARRKHWNEPVRWPALLLVVGLIAFFAPVAWQYHQRGHRPALKRKPL